MHVHEWLALSMLALGCASTPPAEPPPPAPVITTPPANGAEPVSAAPVEDVSDAAATPPQRRGEGALPGVETARAALGEPCPPATGKKLDVCGQSGRVSIEVDELTVAVARAAGCKLERLGDGKPSPYAASACIEGDVIYAQNACIACRLIGAGWSAKARIGDLTNAQALELAKQLGIAGAQPLRSVDDWRRALAGAKAP